VKAFFYFFPIDTMNNQLMKKYLGYIRVSNKEHENSLPTQRPIVQDYARRHDHELVHVYEEKKSAFGKVNRKIFNEMIEHLRREDIAGVIFHKVDRSSRNMKDFALLEELFNSKDIRVVEGEFDTKKAQGRFQFRMFCNMAVWYSENLSEEVNAKMQSCLKNGYFPGVSYFGYRKGRKPNEETGEKGDHDPRLKYPDHNARYVRETFEMYDSGNHSFYSIAKIMRERGIKGAITKGQVERILCNRFYIGISDWKRKRGVMQTYAGKHQPLISPELFDRVQARREGRTRSKGGYGNDVYSRVFECGCQHPLYPESPTSCTGKKYSYLRCHNHACGAKSIRREAMEDLIVSELRKFSVKTEFFTNYQEAMQGMSKMIAEENASQRAELNARLIQIDGQMERVRDGFVRGIFNAEETEKRKMQLENERKTLTQRLHHEYDALDEAYFKTATQFVQTFQTIADRYKTAPSDLKREILDFFFSKKELTQGKLVLKPNPIMQQVALIADLSNGRGGGTRTRGLLVPNQTL
jgi:site-specific DNA recombinase